jgi:putative ABC transport system substrate-binding protein
MPLTADDAGEQEVMLIFVKALQQLGWTDGRNLRIDFRGAGANLDDSRKYATELVALAPDVILSIGGVNLPSLQQATRTIPIVFLRVPDPVAAGFVDSLARPGGNATGFASIDYSVSTKWLELLKEIAPDITRAAVVRDATLAAGTGQFGAIQAMASSAGIAVTPINVRDASEIERDGVRGRPKRRPDCDFERLGKIPSRFDCRARASTAAACCLLSPRLRDGWLPDLLWDRSERPVSPRSRLRRPHPQR